MPIVFIRLKRLDEPRNLESCSKISQWWRPVFQNFLFIVVCMHDVCAGACGSQRTTLWIWSSPFIFVWQMCGLNSGHLAGEANVFTHWAVTPAWVRFLSSWMSGISETAFKVQITILTWSFIYCLTTGKELLWALVSLTVKWDDDVGCFTDCSWEFIEQAYARLCLIFFLWVWTSVAWKKDDK